MHAKRRYEIKTRQSEKIKSLEKDINEFHSAIDILLASKAELNISRESKDLL